jgi:hypothetical protein
MLILNSYFKIDFNRETQYQKIVILAVRSSVTGAKLYRSCAI